ncbi:MAG: sigma-70 family RNA polymerase sigma factor [Planctomycetales bacterium]|nr:sigma-70 family RNA polymerase sigma factor [Planctomycetales bacterium]
MSPDHDITVVIQAVVDGRADRTRDLLPLVYDELKQMAMVRLTHERNDHTLQPTALVHEAYLRLQPNAGQQQWENRAHFFGAAAEAMRRILVEHARGKQRVKRGGSDRQRIDLTSLDDIVSGRSDELLALDDALTALAEAEPTKAELVKLKFFGGLTTHEAGEFLGLSPRTAERHWSFARAWLYREMTDEI